jgi:hypothetical protein
VSPRGAPRRSAVGLLLAVLLTTACSTATDRAGPPAADQDATTTTTATAPAPPATPSATATPSSSSTDGPPNAPGTPPSRTRLDDWTVGAHPLPLRPDGFGQVLPTPRELRVRRMPTRDLLPAPKDGRFHSSIGRVTPKIRRRMGETWSPRCPVGLDDLRYLNVGFQGFDGRPHTGELVVNAAVARDVVAVFRTLYRARFPIEEMRLPTTADLEAPPTGDGNDTAALVCRATRGQTTWSAHAYGLAIDLNPFMNPYHKGDLVLPELASAYLDRSWRRPGMILPGGVVTRAFARIGWTWGGDYHSLKDLMHFSSNGR